MRIRVDDYESVRQVCKMPSRWSSGKVRPARIHETIDARSRIRSNHRTADPKSESIARDKSGDEWK